MSRSESWGLASIVWHEQAGVRYVVVAGEVDLTSAEAFGRALDSDRLHIDMSGVEFFDSVGLKTLIQARIGAVEFQLTANRMVRRVLEIAGVTAQLNLVPETQSDSV